jgi:hypothetical protein
VASTGKNLRDRAVSRPDFNYGSLGNIAERIDDCMPGRIIYKKVLPELWLMFHLHPMSCDLPLID